MNTIAIKLTKGEAHALGCAIKQTPILHGVRDMLDSALREKELLDVDRYEVGSDTCIMFLISDGDYVRYSDYEKLLAAYQRAQRTDGPNSLDAIHQEEAKLTDEEHYIFRCHLRNAVTTTGAIPSRAYVSATTGQRAEALLRTIGRWNETRVPMSARPVK